MLKKFWISLAIASTLLMSAVPAHAAAGILPSDGGYDCSSKPSDIIKFANNGAKDYNQTQAETFLACALELGYVRFWMIPYFVIYAQEFLIGLAGLVTVLMVVLGGYYYIAGGVTDDKEKGKHIITYALGGFILVLTSWFIVNLLLLTLTS